MIEVIETPYTEKDNERLGGLFGEAWGVCVGVSRVLVSPKLSFEAFRKAAVRPRTRFEPMRDDFMKPKFDSFKPPFQILETKTTFKVGSLRFLVHEVLDKPDGCTLYTRVGAFDGEKLTDEMKFKTYSEAEEYVARKIKEKLNGNTH